MKESLLSRDIQPNSDEVGDKERCRISSVADSEIGIWQLRPSITDEVKDERPHDFVSDTSPSEDLTNAYVILYVLLFTFISNQWSRQSINYLINFSDETDDSDKDQYMNLDLNFDQEQYATISSVVFAVVFAAFSLIAGSICDKFRRDWIGLMSCIVWSAATAMQAFITDYGLLCVARIIMAISQAFFNPVAYTLLVDLFPKSKLAQANGIFTVGVYVGGGLSSISIVIDHKVGWRMTMLIIASVGGLASILLFLFVKEPREEKKNVEDAAYGDMIKVASRNLSSDTDGNEIVYSNIQRLRNLIEDVGRVLDTRQARYIYIASTVRFMAGFSILTWKAPFIFNKFDGKEELFSFINAIVVGVVGLLSTVLGGYLADFIANPPEESSRKPRARAWVPAICSFLSVPCWIFFIQAPTLELTMVALSFEYLFAECWFGPTLATLFTVVDPKVRGTAQGMFSIISAIGNVAPLLMGFFAGGSAGNHDLGEVMLFTIGGFYAISGIIFVKVAIIEDKNLEHGKL